MAEHEKPKQTVVINGSDFTIENSQQQTILDTNEANVGEDIDDEILQQAFGGVSQTFEQNGSYKDENGENVTLIADGSVLTDVSGNVVGTINDDGSTYTLSSPLNISEATQTGTIKISEGNVLKDAGTCSKVIESAGSATAGLAKTQEVVQGDVSGKVLQLPTTSTFSANQPLFVIRSPSNSASTATENSSNNVLSSLIKCTPTTLATLSSQIAPLGSSQNPIRIIQQGNQYTSTQQLNPEQLSQIMQVVQQQQAVRQAKQMGGTSVIYNPETQTKIVYRVINPADLHTKASDVSTSLKSVQVGASGRTYTGKKRGRKRKIDLKKPDDDTDTTELSRKEKEDKKKNRPKTRSGRVSKPPRHMIKDYKQIHLVDWNEDYDDSDGGYSDYKASGDEDENAKRQRAEEDDYEKLRPKRFACGGCDRRYIGSGGLERHWTNFPDHKTFSKIAEGVAGAGKTDQDEIPTDAEASNDSSTHSFKGLDTKNLETGDSTTEPKDSQITVNGTPGVIEVKVDSTEPKEEVTKGQGDGRQTPVQNTAGKSRPWGRNSRRFKLMDLLERCSDEVVLDVALPRLARNCSVWNFLLSKAEAEKEAEEEGQREAEEEEDELQVRLNFRDVYQQYEQLRLKVKQLYAECKVTEDMKADTLENSGDMGMLTNPGGSDKSKQILNQTSSETKGDEGSDTILFEFSNAESASSLGEQCSVSVMTSEIPEHYSDMPASVCSYSRFKPTQEKYVSPGPGSMRKSKPKLYPGAVSVIPPLEIGRKPRILGDSKPLEESEIRAQMLAKRPPANRLKLWVKNEDDEEEEEEFPFFDVKKESSVTSTSENLALKSPIVSKEGHNNDVDMNGAAADSVKVSHSASRLQRIDTSQVEGSLTLPESTSIAKDTDMKCTIDTPTIQTVGNVTAIIHSEPILSEGNTVRITSDELFKGNTENAQTLTKANLPADVGPKIENGSKAMDSNKTVECRIPDFKSVEFSSESKESSSLVNSHITSQVSQMVSDSSAESKSNIFILQAGDSSPKKTGSNLGKRESMTPGNLQNHISKPVTIMTQRAKSSKTTGVTKVGDVTSCISESIHTSTHEMSEDTKCKIHLQQSPRTVKKQTLDETTGTVGNSIMVMDQGVVVENLRDSSHSSSVLALNTEDQVIPSDIGAFISESQPAMDEDSKLEATGVQLLPELTEETGALPVSSSDPTLLQPSGSSSTVTYQVIDEELAREGDIGKSVVGQDNGEPPVVENVQVLEDVQVLQTGDGIILVKNPDGSFQLHNPHNQPIPIETVQALINLTPS